MQYCLLLLPKKEKIIMKDTVKEKRISIFFSRLQNPITLNSLYIPKFVIQKVTTYLRVTFFPLLNLNFLSPVLHLWNSSWSCHSFDEFFTFFYYSDISLQWKLNFISFKEFFYSRLGFEIISITHHSWSIEKEKKIYSHNMTI